MVPSFHPRLVQGVASYSLELLRAVPRSTRSMCRSGSAPASAAPSPRATRSALRSARSSAVVAASAPAYARSLALGRLVSHDATTRIADGMACRTPVPEALDIIRAGADRVVEVTDDEIEAAMRAIYDDTHNVAEGAAASRLAALLQERDRLQRTAGRDRADRRQRGRRDLPARPGGVSGLHGSHGSRQATDCTDHTNQASGFLRSFVRISHELPLRAEIEDSATASVRFRACAHRNRCWNFALRHVTTASRDLPTVARPDSRSCFHFKRPPGRAAVGAVSSRVKRGTSDRRWSDVRAGTRAATHRRGLSPRSRTTVTLAGRTGRPCRSSGGFCSRSS